MVNKVWNDGGGFDDLLQENIAEAVTAYVNDGYLTLDQGTLEVIYYAADPMDHLEKRKSLADIILSELEANVPGNLPYTVAPTHAFDGESHQANLLKLQQCYHILKGA